ncbi:MAG: adenosylcobinamide-phosphate synthase CbiB [Pseudomonadota bacterium]
MMLAVALLLDAVFGEPRALWSRVSHPVVAMGGLIGWLERRLNAGRGRRAKGAAAVVLLLALVLPIPALIAVWSHGWVLEILGGAILLAHRSLVDHVRAVARGLDASLAEGRRAVSMIVGRAPEHLDESGVARAAIESAAENFSDGVIVPAFWFAVAGLPGIVVYKAVNTADSMIGYRSERYREFGWAAARLDDVLNWVPARLAGLVLCLAGPSWRALRVMIRDAGLHRSPNAGWPEAATAAVLGIALGGPRIYPHETVDDPYLHPEGRRVLSARDIDKTIRLLWRAWVLLLVLAAVLGLLTWW